MNLRKVSGYLLLLAALIGTILSIVGLVEIWRLKPVMTRSVEGTFGLLDQTLKTTQDAVTTVGQALQTISEDVNSLQTTTQALAKTIHDTNPMLDSLSSLASKDLPGAINTTQTSLLSAQSSAQLIDDVLGTLTSIPFLPVTPYKPAVPLHVALGDVSTSLNSIKPALITINTSLTNGKANLLVLENELTKISATTQGISGAVKDAQTIVDQYKTTFTQLKTEVDLVKLNAPTWITSAAWIFTLGLLWLLIAQVGLCWQGVELLKNNQAGIMAKEKVVSGCPSSAPSD